ncbi:MAG: glycosyltransferase family 2 protein [Candidatus Auribacterota bacterium]|jgi:chlorobactene glucosyltransferase|nr:glycosyltransferase family 2 protein [Candidatus Auribacterota bacterium]
MDQQLLLYILWINCGLVVVCMLSALWNSLGYSDVKPKPPCGSDSPFVSLIIPTRNEIANIKTCLDSLLCQDYPKYEVIVIDGDSDDGTRQLLDSYAKKNKRFRWYGEESLPEKWVGKSFACRQGAKCSAGDWLFFIDADTVHDRYMISSVIDSIQRNNVDFFSLMTGQLMGSFWEYVVLPCVFLWFGTRFPIRRVNNPRSKVARATGQFIAVRRDVYEATGGHEAVKVHVVEDFAFAAYIKNAGYRIKIAGGRKIVKTRMYRNFKQIWEGFSKNIFFAAGTSLTASIKAVSYVFLNQILPFFAPLMLLFADNLTWQYVVPALVPFALTIIVRLQLNMLLELPQWYTLTIPIGGFMTVLLHINSAARYLSGRGMVWKGRVYAGSKQK